MIVSTNSDYEKQNPEDYSFRVFYHEQTKQLIVKCTVIRQLKDQAV